jgi:chemosensory pili system protein ChpC
VTSAAKDTKQKHDVSLRCLLIPVVDSEILLPNTVVAEITVIGDTNKIGNLPEWIIDYFTWRGIDIPLISFNKLLDRDVDSGNRVAVINTLDKEAKYKFIGVSISGIPRTININPEMVEYSSGNVESNDSPVLATLILEDKEVIVPDLEYLHKRLEQLVN